MRNSLRMASAARWRDQIARHFGPSPELLIPALQYVQHQAGYLPREAIAAVAQHLRVPEAKVFGVASFYALFHLEPRGRNRIIVCRGTACHVHGSAGLLESLEKLLGVKAGGTATDKLFSLETVGCLGTCALATPIVVNDRVYGRQTSASAVRLVKALLASARAARKARAATREKPAGRKRKSRAG